MTGGFIWTWVSRRSVFNCKDARAAKYLYPRRFVKALVVIFLLPVLKSYFVHFGQWLSVTAFSRMLWRPFLKNLVNTDVKKKKKRTAPPHFSTTEVRVSPTCPSSDCSHKLTSNGADSDQVSVRRRTGRLEERPSCCHSSQCGVQTPCRGVAAYSEKKFQMLWVNYLLGIRKP